MHLKIDENKENNNEINMNKSPNSSIYNNIRKMNNNNIKKINSLNEKEKINLKNSSMDASYSSDLRNNFSNNIINIKHKNNELNMNCINSNFNNKNNSIRGSLSNPNREKISFKLKSNSGLGSSMIIRKNNKTKRDISTLYGNDSINKKKNNYIRLKQYNIDEQNEFDFHLPNLKKSNVFNLYGFKKKPKINLNQLKIKLNLNYKINNDFINNNKNKYLLSPKNRRLKRSESNTLMKSTINSSNNKNNNNNLFSSNTLRRNNSNFSSNIRNNSLYLINVQHR